MTLKFLHGMPLRLGIACLAALAALCGLSTVRAAEPAPAIEKPRPPVAGNIDIAPVLQRAREAARRRNYVGTFVVLSANGAMASSRIWHLSEASQQIERMETLTGKPRLVFRRNDQVVTYLPDAQVARVEQRDAFGLFPHLPRMHAGALSDSYLARAEGVERVAGLDTEVFRVTPRDALRYGYRIWMERRTGFAVQLQTTDRQGHVLEQAAFSDIEFDAPLRADKMQQAMGNTSAYRVEKLERIKTSADAEGWLMRSAVAGFEPMDCYRKSPDAPAGAVQWIFSDGLATVSLFIEPYGPEPRKEWRNSAGMTQMIGRRIASDWWLTAMGEVPPQTLEAFAATLERRP